MVRSTITREQILAFRLRRCHLARRLPAAALVAAAAVCGIQNSPPGAALLAFHARVEGVTGDALDRALLADKTLVQVWSVRAAPLIAPAAEAAIFTLGLLPANEEELRFLIRGAGDHLNRVGLPATDLVDWTATALAAVLDGRQMTKDDLGVALSRRLASQVPAAAAALWDSPDPWGHFGESLARFALNAVSLRGAFCLVSHGRGAATFVRTDQWLGHPFAATGDEAVQLLRRYLGAYGPSTAGAFAQWAGIAPAQARRLWRLVEDELVAVQWGRQALWLPAADAQHLAQALAPAAAGAAATAVALTDVAPGVRLLPPHDPYLASRDRRLLLPDTTRHAQIWRAAGSPGAVLYNGEIVGLWRPQKQRTTLHLAVTEFASLSAARSEIEAEARALALLRGCTQAAVTFAASAP